MSYHYQTERAEIFTEDGQVMFLCIRDTTNKLLKVAGAARCSEMMSGVTGSTWTMLACIDRLVELKEIREVTAPGSCAGQHRVFVRSGE